MNVVITGGAGFIGKRLAGELLSRGVLMDKTIERLTIADIAAPADLPETLRDDPRLIIKTGDYSAAAAIDELINADGGADAVFHLAAVVSGGAEEDFDLGMRVNLYGSLYLLEACRRLPKTPIVVFASSVAVYGGALPEIVQDDTHLTPQTSYGVQKTAIELLINDYSRKGFIDGRALRLPTVIVRPGKPNKAASSFASAVIREPLNGVDYDCPVKPETDIWALSPRRVIEAFIHAAELPAERWGTYRGIALPGITVSIRAMVDALGELSGPRVVERIHWRPDPVIENIVYGWATRFNPKRALDMGFQPDSGIAEIIQAYIDDELNGQIRDER